MTIPMFSRSSDVRTLALGSGCEGSSFLSWLYQDELPDTVWFILGTASHEAIEATILEGLSKEDLIAVGKMNLQVAVAEAEATGNGILESGSTRAKRSLATAQDDLVRMLGKWWDDVHPDSEKRNPLFDSYKWPPTVEHVITLPDVPLYTTVDAIFHALPGTAPFGHDVMIVDWKSGSTSKSHESQLHVYAYGGRKEGWFPKDATAVGFFWHLDHSKAQHVGSYLGDDVVEAWLRRTVANKQATVETGVPVFVPDWWCGYCQSKYVCPVEGGATRKTLEQVGIDIASAVLLDEPQQEENV